MRAFLSVAAGAVLLGAGFVAGEREAYAEGGNGWLGWRAGITPDGEWSFFVAGD